MRTAWHIEEWGLLFLLLLGCGGDLPAACPSPASSAYCCPPEAFQERCVSGHLSRCEPIARGVDESGAPAVYLDLWNYVGECPR